MMNYLMIKLLNAFVIQEEKFKKGEQTHRYQLLKVNKSNELLKKQKYIKGNIENK